MNHAPVTSGDAVADLYRVASNRSLTSWTLASMLICFRAERMSGVPVPEAFQEALRQAGRVARA
jgi:hypothetical protein